MHVATQGIGQEENKHILSELRFGEPVTFALLAPSALRQAGEKTSAHITSLILEERKKTDG